jgi:HK97 gp10 family phage protein
MADNSDIIRVEGLKAINKKLKALDEDTNALAQMNYRAAQTLITEAKPLTPVKTGALRASLKASKSKAFAAVRGGSAKVPYAAPIHWGWFYDKNWFIKKNIMPNPFLGKALKLSREEIMSKYQKDMEALIKKHQL